MITYLRMLSKMGALIIWSTVLLSIFGKTFGVGEGWWAVLIEGKACPSLALDGAVQKTLAPVSV